MGIATSQSRVRYIGKPLWEWVRGSGVEAGAGVRGLVKSSSLFIRKIVVLGKTLQIRSIPIDAIIRPNIILSSANLQTYLPSDKKLVY